MAECTIELIENTNLNDRYIIYKTLGAGGFGITYQAYDTEKKRKCAIKEFVPRGIVVRMGDGVSIVPVSDSKRAMFEHGMERFLEEAEILQRLNHVNAVVSVYDFFQENGTCYFVMEFLEGLTLGKLIAAQGGKLPYETVADVLRRVGNALIQVHSRNIFHRDISPDNIFITAQGEVKIIDFGNAKNLIRNDEEKLSVVLKPGFAPPEQYSSTGKQGTFTDVYALASTTYYALTGKKVPDAIERTNKGGYVTLEELGFEKYISDAIDRALALRYRERTQTIPDFLADLRIPSEKPVSHHNTLITNPQQMQDPVRPKQVNPQRQQMPNQNVRQQKPQPVRNVERQRREIPILILKNRSGQERKYKLPIDAGVVIGKAEGMAQIVITGDPHISRKHCELFYDSKAKMFYIVDYSTNGTFLDGRKLEHGKIYQLGAGIPVWIGNENNIVKAGVVYE